MKLHHLRSLFARTPLASAKPRIRPHFEQLEERILLSADLSPLGLDYLEPVLEQALYHNSKEIIFIDHSVANAQQFFQDIIANADDNKSFEVIELDANQDGIAQISSVLTHRNDLSGIHIIAHGTDNAVNLGNTTLSNENLAE